MGERLEPGERPVTVTLGGTSVQASLRPASEWRKRDKHNRPLGFYRLARDLFSPHATSIELVRTLIETKGSYAACRVSNAICQVDPTPTHERTFTHQGSFSIVYAERTSRSSQIASIIAPYILGNDQVGATAYFVGDHYPGTLTTAREGAGRIITITADREGPAFRNMIDETLCAMAALIEVDRQL